MKVERRPGGHDLTPHPNVGLEEGAVLPVVPVAGGNDDLARHPVRRAVHPCPAAPNLGEGVIRSEQRDREGNENKEGNAASGLQDGSIPLGVQFRAIFSRGLQPGICLIPLARCMPFRAYYPYSVVRRSRRALPTTETELKLMAAAAMMGLRRIPKSG
jgi:hypothetical protein